MKKYLLLLSVVLVFLLTACDTNGTPSNDNDAGPLPTPYTDALTLDEPFEGRSFINDGIGEVELTLCIDGDTARFREITGGEDFSVRFLGIDTPESTSRIEPWGQAATDFVCEKLTNAEQIVLQADPNRERLDNTGNRYLGFVWYDGRLINLEVIEQAFSHSGAITTQYGVMMYDAWVDVRETGRRIHGELDPDFDYDSIKEHITVQELVESTDLYLGKFITIEGVITRTEGGHPWIQQDGYGVYLYSGFEFTTRLVVGNEIRLTEVQPTFWPNRAEGALQLSNFRRHNLEVLSEGNVVDPMRLDINELTERHIGTLVGFENLTLTSDASGNDFTINAEDENGNTIQIRKNTRSNFSFEPGILTSGTTINITGPITVYRGVLQIVITTRDDVEILD